MKSAHESSGSPFSHSSLAACYWLKTKVYMLVRTGSVSVFTQYSAYNRQFANDWYFIPIICNFACHLLGCPEYYCYFIIPKVIKSGVLFTGTHHLTASTPLRTRHLTASRKELYEGFIELVKAVFNAFHSVPACQEIQSWVKHIKRCLHSGFQRPFLTWVKQNLHYKHLLSRPLLFPLQNCIKYLIFATSQSLNIAIWDM